MCVNLLCKFTNQFGGFNAIYIKCNMDFTWMDEWPLQLNQISVIVSINSCRCFMPMWIYFHSSHLKLIMWLTEVKWSWKSSKYFLICCIISMQHFLHSSIIPSVCQFMTVQQNSVLCLRTLKVSKLGWGWCKYFLRYIRTNDKDDR